MARKPTQARAKATVDAIVEAGFISMKNNGIENTTTKKIAAIAGVSVGSIYEYFGNKDDIYQAMVQVFVDENIAMLREATPDILHLSFGDMLRTLLYRYRDILQANDGRYIQLLKFIGSIETEAFVGQAESVLMDIIMKYAMHNPQLIKLPNLLTVCYVSINGAIFSVIRYLNQPTAAINFDTMVDVIAAMIENHVQTELAQHRDGLSI